MQMEVMRTVLRVVVYKRLTYIELTYNFEQKQFMERYC